MDFKNYNKIYCLATSSYDLIIFFGWAKHLRKKLVVFHDFLIDDLNKHKYIEYFYVGNIFLNFLPNSIKNIIIWKKYLKLVSRNEHATEDHLFLHDYGKINQCKDLKQRNISVYAIPHTTNIEDYKSFNFTISKDCGIKLLVQKVTNTKYFNSLGFHNIVEMGIIDWNELNRKYIDFKRNAPNIILLPKLHLKLLKLKQLKHLNSLSKKSSEKTLYISHPRERKISLLVYKISIFNLKNATHKSGGLGSCSLSYANEIWTFYSDITNVNISSKVKIVSVRIKSKEDKFPLPHSLSYYHQLWL